MQEVTPEYMASDAYIDDIRAGRRELPSPQFNLNYLPQQILVAKERLQGMFSAPQVGVIDVLARESSRPSKNKRKALKQARRQNRK